MHDGGLQIDVDKDTVKDAPNIDDGDALTGADEIRPYEHHHIDPTGGGDAYVAKQRAQHG